MGWYLKLHGTPGPGIPKDEPKPTGLRLFFSVLFREWKTLVKLNLIFLLCCIPVITIPAALCAMQHITLKMIQDEPFLLWTDFRRTFRRVFKRGSLWGWGYFFMALATAFCLNFYAQMELYHIAFLLPFVCAAAFLLLLGLSGIYLFPLLVRSEMTGFGLVRNACLMALGYFTHGFPALLFNAALALLCDLFFPLAWPATVLILFALQSLVASFSAWPDICSQLQRSGEAPAFEFDSEK